MSGGSTWQMKTYFDEFNGKEMQDFLASLKKDLSVFEKEIMQAEPLSSSNMEEWEKHFLAYEELFKRITHIGSYAGCLAAADAHNEDYAKLSYESGSVTSAAEKFKMLFKGAFKNATDKEFEEFVSRKQLETAAPTLRRYRKASQRTMSDEMEALTADLSVNGFSSWTRLYGTVSGKLNFEMEWPDGKKETIPAAQCRSLCANPDRKLRKAAFEGGKKAWRRVEDVCAAALNALAGTRLTLAERRGYGHFLDVALEQSAISQECLKAMMQAVDEAKEIKLLAGKAKAKVLGLEKLCWYDCEAALQIPGVEKYSWEQALKIIEKAFDKHYPALGTFFRKVIEKQWVDSVAKEGKRPGAFCSSSLYNGESRVFMSYTGSISDISTLAHEVGHAFHSSIIKKNRALCSEYPMTLAETASNFAEIILAEGILNDPEASDSLKLSILTNSVNDIISHLIDIPIRFHFEKRFHEARQKGEVPPSALKEIMRTTMKEQFVGLLEDGGEDELFWASKLHFYADDVTFYNYPYIFGMLLSNAMMQTLKKEGAEAFLPKYELFLERSGAGEAQTIAKKTLGFDLEDSSFWSETIEGLKGRVEKFNALADKLLKM
ncbi:MAG: M3 family oligoendopeptidase [Candidatus Riflebacteria bacterium]|nr:M3 family oligoendopeptidase [Candidatus Riflebacteria bacterium]